MVVENVHIIQVHPLQGLIQAGNQVFPAAVVAVGAGPHVVAGLGGNHQLVPVGAPVPIHVDAEIPLGLAVGWAVVVGQVKVGDAQVKGLAQNALLSAEGGDIPKIVP